MKPREPVLKEEPDYSDTWNKMKEKKINDAYRRKQRMHEVTDSIFNTITDPVSKLFPDKR